MYLICITPTKGFVPSCYLLMNNLTPYKKIVSGDQSIFSRIHCSLESRISEVEENINACL